MINDKKHQSFFDGVFTKKDLRKTPPPKPPNPTEPPPLNAATSSAENSAVLENLEKVLDHFNEIGMPEKARFLKMVFEKPINFSKYLLEAVEGPDDKEEKEKMNKLNELAPSDATALLLRLDLSNAQYQEIAIMVEFNHFTMLQKLSKCEVKD